MYPYDSRVMKFYKVSASDQDDYRISAVTKSKEKYDVVNCQFAIHYFFKNAGTLNNMIRNVKESLVKNGLFVVTCLDGKRVLAKMKEGKYKTSAVVMTLGKMNEDNIVGNEIQVDLKGTKYFQNKSSAEYLVDVKAFTKVMENHGFELIESNSFEKYSNDKKFKDAVSVMDDYEKKYSFMNSMHVFKLK